ncbi:MAG: DUF2062 domain-containing protein [Gammaproteobacteria bacterium]|nr:DUF2062 domain-containing protein [Gammaproteobacteria bacterium]MDH5730093.1 DUF2062 domain-containing protein [Gammaproteobacteria bacterium]
MPRKLIRRYLPTPEKLKSFKSLQVFGDLLTAPNLWHLNKRSVSGAVSVGLFSAFVPIPFQMLLAAAVALFFRVNLPISVALVWVSNPFTMPPLFYGAYVLGAWVLDVPILPMNFELSLSWLKTELLRIWEPFLLGCFLVGTFSAITGHLLMRYLWRMHVIKHWKERRRRRQLRLLLKKKRKHEA